VTYITFFRILAHGNLRRYYNFVTSDLHARWHAGAKNGIANIRLNVFSAIVSAQAKTPTAHPGKLGIDSWVRGYDGAAVAMPIKKPCNVAIAGFCDLSSLPRAGPGQFSQEN
jgi:hypothetical protein